MKTLSSPNGTPLAYIHTPGKSPTVMFLGGFRSDMTGSKATALEAYCKAQGQAFLRMDYSGHGQSGGKFEEGTIGQWRDDVLQVLDNVIKGPVILVGSSMGGWLMLLVALARKERVRGLLGIASAPDFTEKLIWEQFTPAQKQEMEKTGKVSLPDCYGTEPYAITRGLIEEGRKHLLLDAPIALSCPVRLLHGMRDEDVPWQFSVTLSEKLQSEDVRVTLIKSGNHRLSEPEDLTLLTTSLSELILV